MKTTELVVTKCKGCPFSVKELEFADCFAPVQIHTGKYNISSYYKNNTSPKWCPLKTNELLITFKK